MIDYSRFSSGLISSARLLLLPVVAASFIACESGGEADDGTAADGRDTSASSATMGDGDPVKRGEYLVTVIGGCGDCHTPFKMGEHGPEPDMTMMLAGHPEQMQMPPAPQPQGPWLWAGAATNTAFAGPWGVTYAINLTPDSLTGLGNWTEDQFLTALKTGRHMGTSRPIMPPMPWQNLARATDDDLKAIYAYLRSIPPIKNQAPAYEPPAGGMTSGAPPGGAPADTGAASDTTNS